MTSHLGHSSNGEKSWRSIILLGRNVSSYKFALAKTLLEKSSNDTFLRLDELALPYALHIAEHLKLNDKQTTSRKSTFLDYCRKYNLGEITEDQLRESTVRYGFTHVINAFHNVAHSEVSRFFEDARREKGGIILSDSFFELSSSSQRQNLDLEVNARWRLWETAVSLNVSPHLLQIRLDETAENLFVIDASYKRRDVTTSREALNGYQQGRCFYCSAEIMIQPGQEKSCDVDHFFPHKLKKLRTKEFQEIDQVWNLVLACKVCNRGQNGKFERIPDNSFLSKLHGRNNYFVESHHPLRETILNQIGHTEEQRRLFLKTYSRRVDDAMPIKEKWKPRDLRG